MATQGTSQGTGEDAWTREAFEVVKSMVTNAMAAPTEAIMDRLDKLEERMRDQEPQRGAIPTGNGMLSSVGGGY